MGSGVDSACRFRLPGPLSLPSKCRPRPPAVQKPALQPAAVKEKSGHQNEFVGIFGALVEVKWPVVAVWTSRKFEGIYISEVQMVICKVML